MILVYQTRFGDKNGNCFQACVASLFELTLEQVPDFCNEEPRDEWSARYIRWLNERGLSYVPLELVGPDALESDWLRDCFVIVSGKNADDVRHCVIYRNGQPAHNPNRNCRGITPDRVDIIFPREPR